MGVIEKENELISSRYLTNSLRIAIDKSVDKIIASNRELSQTITKYSNIHKNQENNYKKLSSYY